LTQNKLLLNSESLLLIISQRKMTEGRGKKEKKGKKRKRGGKLREALDFLMGRELCGVCTLGYCQ